LMEPTTRITRTLLITLRDLSSRMLENILNIRKAGINREMIVRVLLRRNIHLAGAWINFTRKSKMKITQIMFMSCRRKGVRVQINSIIRRTSHAKPRIIKGISVMLVILTSSRYLFISLRFFKVWPPLSSAETVQGQKK
jgi:hypothetical protein